MKRYPWTLNQEIFGWNTYHPSMLYHVPPRTTFGKWEIRVRVAPVPKYITIGLGMEGMRRRWSIRMIPMSLRFGILYSYSTIGISKRHCRPYRRSTWIQEWAWNDWSVYYRIGLPIMTLIASNHFSEKLRNIPWLDHILVVSRGMASQTTTTTATLVVKRWMLAWKIPLIVRLRITHVHCHLRLPMVRYPTMKDGDMSYDGYCDGRHDMDSKY